MTVMSLEVDLPRINARWVVVGFGVDPIMSRLPGLLRRLGPRSMGFPRTAITAPGVARRTAAPTSVYMVVVDSEDSQAPVSAHQFVQSLSGSEHLAMFIWIGRPLAPILTPDGTLQLQLAQPAGSDLILASLLMAVTGNGLIGIDLADIRNCLGVAGPALAWLWEGHSGHLTASAASDLAKSASDNGIPPADLSGATVMAIVPLAWKLNDIVELACSVPLPEAVNLTLAAFTDDAPDAAPRAVVLMGLALQDR